MSMPAEAAEPAQRIVGKKQLSEVLGWSRMKLDRRLEADAAFPVHTRGDQAGGWGFDLDLVNAYLEHDGDELALDEADDEAAPRSAVHGGEQTARQRRDAAQAQLLEDKIRRQRGELVDAADLKMALSETVSRVASTLNKMPETLMRRLNLPPSAEGVLRQEMDEVRRQLVVGLREMLSGG